MLADLIEQHRPWQDTWELEEFLTWCQARVRPGGTIVEIGTHRGGLTRCLRDALAPATLVSVDVDPLEPSDGWHQVIGRSQDANVAAQVQSLVGDGRPVDLLFIDGGHSYPEAIEDHRVYAALVRSGGIVALHDIGAHPGDSPIGCHVSIVWNELERAERCVTWRAPGGPGIGAYLMPDMPC